MSNTGSFRYLFAAVVVALLNTQTLAKAEDSVTESNRQIITEAFEKWSAGGSTFFDDVLAHNVVWTIKGSSPTAGTYDGRDQFVREAVKPFVERLSAPLRPSVNHIWADGDAVIVYWDDVATAIDGKPYSNSYVWIFTMKDGRASRVTAFLDLELYEDVIKRITPANP